MIIKIMSIIRYYVNKLSENNKKIFYYIKWL